MSIDPMLAPIPGDDNERIANATRMPDIEQNKKLVKGEFIGLPTVCYELVKTIIHLRRTPDSQSHRDQFYSYLQDYQSVLLQNLDVRWLLSICDTLVDIGDPLQSATAMNIVQCINRCNIDYTLLINLQQATFDGRKLASELKLSTWGGMITADVPNGDMMYNMQTRLANVLKGDQLCNAIWCRICELSADNNNIPVNILVNHSRHQHQRQFFICEKQ